MKSPESDRSEGPLIIADPAKNQRMARTLRPVEVPQLIEPAFSPTDSPAPSDNSKHGQSSSIPFVPPSMSDDSLTGGGGLSQTGHVAKDGSGQQHSNLGFSGLKLGKKLNFLKTSCSYALLYFQRRTN